MYFSAADDADMDGKHWIGCDGCAKWNHSDCEITRGINKEYRDAAEESLRLLALEMAAEEQNATSAHNQNEAGDSVNKADVEMQDCSQAKHVTDPKKK